jgi:hypothetical protein
MAGPNTKQSSYDDMAKAVVDRLAFVQMHESVGFTTAFAIDGAAAFVLREVTDIIGQWRAESKS